MHKVARLQAALRLGALEQVLRGQALEHHGRTGLKRDGVGQLANTFGGHHAQVAVAAGRLAGIRRAVAHLQVRHALAHGLNHARGLHAQLQRQGQGVQAATLVHINKVQPHRVVADANLAGAGLAHRHGDELELLRAASLVNADGARCLGRHVKAPSFL